MNDANFETFRSTAISRRNGHCLVQGSAATVTCNCNSKGRNHAAEPVASSQKIHRGSAPRRCRSTSAKLTRRSAEASTFVNCFDIRIHAATRGGVDPKRTRQARSGIFRLRSRGCTARSAGGWPRRLLRPPGTVTSSAALSDLRAAVRAISPEASRHREPAPFA